VDPLTVAYVGNFSKPFCTEVHVAGSLERLGHTVVRIQENRVDWARLPQVIDHAGADVWMWTRTWDVPHDLAFDAIVRIRKAGIPSVFYHLDRWWGLEREYQIHSEPFFTLDLVVTPDDQAEKWAAAGVNHMWMPPAVYAAECVPATPNPRRWPHAVVFVGSYPYPHPGWAPYRHELISRLQARYGERFGIWPRRGQVRGRDLRQLYATAKVVVGDSCLVGDSRSYISDRVPETIGRGGLLVHPHVDGVTDGTLYADREHLVTYPLGDFDEMLRVVDYYLEHEAEREKIRAAGRAHVAANHTYGHRMAAVLAAVEGVRV
jgi:hypothetical protein